MHGDSTRPSDEWRWGVIKAWDPAQEQARHHVDGLWLNHFSINLNNQHIDLKGEAFVATHVQQLLSNLQQFKPFAQTPFSIEHIAHNSMQKEKQSKSSPQVASLYHFSLINYTPQTNKNGGKK